MASEIEIASLIGFEASEDGAAVKLHFEDDKGRAVGLIIPRGVLPALVVTLPSMASKAVQRASGDPSTRITYPLRECQIEATDDDLRILTIGTPDAFTVSFSLTEELSQELGEALKSGAGARAKVN